MLASGAPSRRCVRSCPTSHAINQHGILADGTHAHKITASTIMPRSSLPSFPSFPPRRLVVLMLMVLLLAGDRARLVSADLLTLIVTATNAPQGALDQAQQDAAAFLQKFGAMEGSSYTVIAPGQTVPSAARMLRGDVLGDADVQGQSDREEDDASPLQKNRKLIDCPNACSNSGSNTCRLLGCAYCGRCRRRLQQQLSKNKQRKIESLLSSDLTAGYCQGKLDCSFKAAINRVNADGTMSLAV
jgi:hypothetical protein